MTLTPIILDQLHTTFGFLTLGMVMINIAVGLLIFYWIDMHGLSKKYIFIMIPLFILFLIFAILQAFMPAIP